jgi:transcriptional regulator
MYVPPAFRETDLPVLQAVMRGARLANLVTATHEGLIATPLPLFLAAEEGPYGTLYGHLARANPQGQRLPTGDAMALFSGPEA